MERCISKAPRILPLHIALRRSPGIRARAHRVYKVLRISPEKSTETQCIPHTSLHYNHHVRFFTTSLPKMAASNQTGLQVPKPQRPTLRRLSSQTSTKEEVKDAGDNVVVVPHRFMLQRAHSYSHGIAASFGKAREELASKNLEDEDSSAPTSPATAPGTPQLYAASPSVVPDSAPLSPITPLSPNNDLPSASTFAFAFDIDGVLVRGGKAIPEAIEAMRMLNGENEWGVKV